MSRKNYKAIAEAMRIELNYQRTIGEMSYAAAVQMVKALAQSLKSQNGAFDETRFFEACGI